jgi:hypothetical protein
MPHLGPKAFDAAVLAFLRQRPATAPEILAHLYASYGRCTNRGTFQMRLRRQVRCKVTAKLLVKGRNVYVPAEAVADVAGRFDLTPEHASSFRGGPLGLDEEDRVAAAETCSAEENRRRHAPTRTTDRGLTVARTRPSRGPGSKVAPTA